MAIASILFVVFLVLFIIGLVSPQKALFWRKDKSRSRKMSALVYGGLTIVFLIIGASLTPVSDTPASTSNTTETATKEDASAKKDVKEEVKSGIDPDAFDENVKAKMAEIDTDGIISNIKTEVSGSFGYVSLTLADISTWGNDETVQKEFINNMGNLMDQVAIISVYEGTEDTIGTQVTVYSPGGLKLGERSIFGNVSLE